MTDRILWNRRTDEPDIDEIVITNATVHVEQMDDRCWWIGISRGDDYWTGNFIVDDQARMRFVEQENHGITWAADDSHDFPRTTDPGAGPTTNVASWMHSYTQAIERYERVCMAVFQHVADGEPLIKLVDYVADSMNGCDCVDEESIALYERAKESAIAADGVIHELPPGVLESIENARAHPERLIRNRRRPDVAGPLSE